MRNPDDPDIAPDSKAAAAMSLAVLGVCTAVAIGGAIPATIALVLARQARSDMDGAEGWLTGAKYADRAIRLGWIAITLAVSTVVLLVAIRLLQGIGPSQRDFPTTVD